MSRIGKAPIHVPANVRVSIEGSTISVEGPLGENSKTFDNSVDVVLDDNILTVVCKNEENKHSCVMHGTVRSIVNSMVLGVLNGYSKNLEINGVGFKATFKGTRGLLLELGYSHDINYEIPAGIKIEIDPSGTKLSVSGVDKKMVGQVAADIKRFCPVEPYKGKGVKIIGEFVRRKEGKKTA